MWKWLHMMVYPAYALIVMHVALGALQSERSPVYAIAVTAGVGLVATLHLVAGWREVSRDRALAGERLAQFHHKGRVCTLTNVCAHQGGPLSEGRIIGGCATCPWHGHQFDPVTGKAPPPYTDQVEVVNVS
jgi:nitrite reductase/ring-hydroxylating ferredoxin subunit